MRIRKCISLFLIAAMVIMMVPLTAFAADPADFSDMPGNWSEPALRSAVDNGLLQGYDGKIMPDSTLTRAQLAAILNRAFGAAEKASLEGFGDVDETSWYYDDMARAVRMGSFGGNGGGLLQPEKNITREEVFVVLDNAFQLSDGTAEAVGGFSDGGAVSGWAKESACALIDAGYVKGADGRLNPQASITRAEFAQLMDNMVKRYIREPGTYSDLETGTVMISVPGVTLKDTVVRGDLILGDGVGDGEVTLENVKVTGRMLVRGGGSNSVVIKGGSEVGSIIVARVDGQVRVYAADGSEIGEITADGHDDVILEGSFASVVILADNITVTAVNADFDTASIQGDNSTLIVKKGSSVGSVTLDGVNDSVQGEGDVDQVLANSSGANIETGDTAVTAAPGSSGVTADGTSVPPGTTFITSRRTIPSGGSSGGSSDDSTASVAAVPTADPAAGGVYGGAEVTLSCATNGASIYYTDDGSTPDATGTLYAAPIVISKDIVIKAIAVKSGMTDSGVLTAEYTILPNFAGGSGTVADPYLVATAAQLNYVRYFPDAHFLQTEDIDLASYLSESGDGYDGGAGWQPIGTEEQPFHGTYDGDGHSIASLSINRPDGEYLGLFGYAQGRTVDEILHKAVISDVCLTNAEITGKWYVGSLIGCNNYNTELYGCTAESVDLTTANTSYGTFGGLTGMNRGTVTNCHVSGAIAGATQAGGLVGSSNDGSISCCSADVEITGQGYLGGLVGSNSYGDIEMCFASGDLSGWYGIGGLVGSHYNGTISDSYATGDATSTEDRTRDCYVGGLIGMTGPGTVQNCYATGEVTAETAEPAGPLYLGGLVGKLPDVGTQPTFAYCYYNSETSGQSDTGRGTPLTTAQMTSQSSYTGWDFSDTWDMASSPASYPYLQWQTNGIPYPPVAFAGGSGTEEAPYQVATPGQLDLVRYYPDAYFIQIAGIDLGGVDNWLPIGFNSSDPNSPEAFSGNYDGQNYIISNMTCDFQVEGDNYVGLFASLNSADIENVALENVNVTGYMLVGGLAGYANSSTIDHCSSSGSVVGGYHTIGGLVGYNYKGTIRDSSSAGTVQAGYGTVGGLAGRLYDGIVESCRSSAAVTSLDHYDAGGLAGSIESSSSISDSYATGDVTGVMETGGLVGRSYSEGTAITGCFAAGDVTGSSAVGGLIGYNNSLSILSNNYASGSVGGDDMIGGFAGQNIGTISNSYSIGAVNADIGNAGGFTGYNTNTLTTGTINSCYYDNDASGQTDEGKGAPRTTAEMTSGETFTGWDFADTWDMASSPASYPYLQWQTDGIPYPPSAFAGGSGTEADPYQVATAEQLDNVRDYLDAFFIQTEDIDLASYLAEGGDGYNGGAGWQPIGSLSTPFTGSYDGNEKSIANLMIAGSDSRIGLFGTASAASCIHDLALTHVNITGNEFIGAIAGMSYGTVETCSVTGTLKGVMSVGGIAGWAWMGSVTSCTGDCTITGTTATNGSRLGIIVGDNYGAVIDGCTAHGVVSGIECGGVVGLHRKNGEDGELKNSFSDAQVTDSTNTAGGLAGTNQAAISNCLAVGNVSGATYVGGLCGHNGGTVSGSCATGVVTGTGNYVGGLIGMNEGDVDNSYATGKVTGYDFVGGLIGIHGYYATPIATITNCYSTGTVIITKLSSEGLLRMGGLIGYKASTSTVTSCYWNKETSGLTSSAGGTGKTTEEMLDQSGYTGWDFTDSTGVWTMDAEPASYPYLQWQTDNIPYPITG